MRYFRNTTTGEVFGYDADQQDLIAEAEAASDMDDITASWPPAIDHSEAKEIEIRSRRNFLLTQSDWTQVADAPVDQSLWATYRQSLRDIPQQAGFPHDIVWPVKPE